MGFISLVIMSRIKKITCLSNLRRTCRWRYSSQMHGTSHMVAVQAITLLEHFRRVFRYAGFNQIWWNNYLPKGFACFVLLDCYRS